MSEERLIAEPEFRHMLGGISHPTFWALEQKPGFPQHINFGRRKVWPITRVIKYIEDIIDLADAEG